MPPLRIQRKRMKVDYDRAERRMDMYGPIRLMASAEGYVLVRRHQCFPFVMSEKDWKLLGPVPYGR